MTDTIIDRAPSCDTERRRLLQLLLTGASAAVVGGRSASAQSSEAPVGGDPAEVLDLWPDGPPGASGVTVRTEIVERENEWRLRDRAISGVMRPTLNVFCPAATPRGTFLLLPGGGYRHVVVDKEGFETARWFAAQGFAAFVLFYRLPSDGWAAGPDAPLQDAQRAIRVIRSAAARYHVDPQRVGVLGFSAGGHLAARLATRHALETYAPVDASDDAPTRPDVAAMVYPVITLQGPAAHAGSRDHLLGPGPGAEQLRRYSAHTDVGRDTPRSFILHAADDEAVPLENTLLMHDALRAAGVATDLHVFAEGGHGFGLRGIANKPVAVWPELLRDWALRCFDSGSRA